MGTSRAIPPTFIGAPSWPAWPPRRETQVVRGAPREHEASGFRIRPPRPCLRLRSFAVRPRRQPPAHHKPPLGVLRIAGLDPLRGVRGLVALRGGVVLDVRDAGALPVMALEADQRS